MRTLILIAVLLPGLAAAAEQQKKKPAPATANPCAQYGEGWVRIQGTNTCVKASGYVRSDFGFSR